MSVSPARKEGFVSKILTVALVGVVLILFVAVAGSYFHWLRGTGSYRIDLAGIIVDKRTTFHESRFGSSMDRILIIEEKDGKRTQVFVNQWVFGQAETGLWFERSKGADKVLPADPSKAKATSH
jgi:hypothetical protein